MITHQRVKTVATKHLKEVLSDYQPFLKVILRRENFELFTDRLQFRCNQLDLEIFKHNKVTTGLMWDDFIEKMACTYADGVIKKMQGVHESKH